MELQSPGAVSMSDQDELRRAPCSVCGGREFIWGHLHGRSNIRFFPTSWFDRTFIERMKGIGVRHVEARVCNACGAVQMFAFEVSDETLSGRG